LLEPVRKPLPAIHRLAPDAFYGWTIAFGLAALSSVVVGIGFYGIAVFLDALATERAWPRAGVSLATTVYFVASGIGGSLIGRAVDRYGSRGFIVAGTTLMAVALLALGGVERQGQLMAVYALLALGFALTGNVPTGAILTRWFVTRRARAMSISQTGVSVGGVVLVPVVTQLVHERGLSAATTVLAALLILFGWTLAAFVLRSDPREFGLAPDGLRDGAAPLPPALQAVEQRVWTPRETLRTPSFWLLVGAFASILFCQVGTAMHQLALLRDHLDARTAALAVSTTAAGSFAARLAVGSFADRISKPRLAALLMCVQGVTLAGFALCTQTLPLFALSLVFGFTIGNVFLLQALLVAECFGMRSFGSVLGLLQLVTQTASGLGPFALGVLHGRLGGYSDALLPVSGLAFVAAALVSRVRPPAR
jgi:MFS family permease